MNGGSDVLSGWLVYYGNVLACSLCWQDIQGLVLIGISLAYMYYICSMDIDVAVFSRVIDCVCLLARMFACLLVCPLVWHGWYNVCHTGDAWWWVAVQAPGMG
jgi:hypothetical protein